MATPIQYTPQFVPTNVGLMNQQLGQMQGKYDQSFANVANMEDQYAQMIVDPSDIQAKNEILGGMRDNFQSIVDKYGGDYGAASKDLVRAISKSKKDPFFQLAPYKRAKAEEERKLRKQLGADYIPGKSIQDVQLYDKETGEYASIDDLDYSYVNRNQLYQNADRAFAALKNQKDYGQFSPVKEAPWLMERRVMQGVSDSNMQGTVQEIAQYMAEQNPDLAPETIMEEATNYAERLRAVESRERVANQNYTNLPTEGGDDNNLPTAYKTTTLPGEILYGSFDDIESKWSEISKRADKYLKYQDKVAKSGAKGSFKEYYEDRFNDVRESNPGLKNVKETDLMIRSLKMGSDPQFKGSEDYNLGQELMGLYYSQNPNGDIKIRDDGSYYSDSYSNIRVHGPNQTTIFLKEMMGSDDLYIKNIESVDNPIFKNMMSIGFSPQDASSVMADFEKNKYITNTRAYSHQSKEVIDGAIGELKVGSNKKIEISYLDQDGDMESEKTSVQALIKDSNFEGVQMLPAKGQLVLSALKDGESRKYFIDKDNLSEQSSEWLDIAQTISEAYYDPKSEGDVIPTGERDRDGSEIAYVIKKNLKISDPENPFLNNEGLPIPGKIKSNIFEVRIKDGKIINSRQSSIEEANNKVMDNLLGTFGYSVKVDAQKVKF